ncbi:MAG TPA: hypothetical protein VKE74_22060 [Gemmataceae bacterium]|nr:hypothetical protein [Gemmataceae bacterium]
MTTKFVFEELDDATRNYLRTVRDQAGVGAPGLFVPTTHTPSGCLMAGGLFVIVLTLLFTLTDWVDLVYSDPTGLALLQTAGLVIGGWMIAMGIRLRVTARWPEIAGYWIYADALHLYEANREQVLVTRLDAITLAAYQHNWNDKKYLNTQVTVNFAGAPRRKLTVNGAEMGERLARFLNRLAFVRGPYGGPRAELPAATLGALVEQFARTGGEPLGADGNPDFSLVRVEITEVPETPTRERRATPRVLPYIGLLVGAAACFAVMREVNVPFHDDAIFAAITKDPVEPRYLRAYLINPQNTRHRDEATARLAEFYDPVIAHVRANGGDAKLREGMAKVLASLRTAEQGVVSIRVRELKSPPGLEAGAADRAKAVRDGIAQKLPGTFTPLTRPIVIPPGVNLNPPPPPAGEQLIGFVEMPDGAPAPHFDLTYRFEPTGRGRFALMWELTIRDDVEKPPVAVASVTASDEFGPFESVGTRLPDWVIGATVTGKQ